MPWRHNPTVYDRSVRKTTRWTGHPGQLVVAAFAVFIFLGTFMLWLPVSRETSQPAVSLLDAFFTASSAVTVTGLVVVDTGSTWSRFGEVIILVMIQVGGLGIMTLAGVLSVFLSRKLGLSQGRLVSAETGVTAMSELKPLVLTLFKFTLVAELVVAGLLAVRFLTEGTHSIGGSLYLAGFHSISAFNNAGFSNLEGGLERYVADWYLNLVVAGAFIAGGLGFPVVLDFWHNWRNPRRWALHSKLTISMSAALLALGTVMLLLVEWGNEQTFGPLATADKFLAAFFQSATARTAGFNTVPVSGFESASVLTMVLLMVIGASAASTGGGIKTSTVLVVVRSTIAEFRGDKEVTLFERRIPAALQRQALALVIAALGTVGTATFLLSVLLPDIAIGDLLFEAASAFGTVGLSRGVTSQLNYVSKVLIIVLMFIGRVGPITFGSALLLRRRSHRFRYPEEQLLIG